MKKSWKRTSVVDMKVLLKADNIVSGYGEIDILKGVTARITKGEIACIIGPNGSGKSTFFKTIFGLLTVRKGSIYFDGKNATGWTPYTRLRSGISYVPQGRCNFPAMTVRENLEMAAFIRNDDKVDKDIETLLDNFQILKKYEKTLVGNLSGGEQQLVEMCGALLLHPKLMLLDEPTLGLAPKFVEFVFEKIKEIHTQGVTLLIVEQNAKKALSISDHAFVLELGKKRFEGTGKEIMNNEEVKKLYLGG